MPLSVYEWVDRMRIDLSTSGLHEIEAKAYLSRKDIEELVLPENVDRIGNWAFAYMRNLKRIIVPEKQIQLGKEVFKGCDSLEQVILRSCDAAENGTANAYAQDRRNRSDAEYLLAAALVKLDAQKLFVPERAGSHEWMREFDRLLLEFMQGEDEIGFNPMWFGGEEDYDDNDTNVEIYRKKRQQEKAGLVILRLVHNSELAAADQKAFSAFLRNLFVGESSKETAACPDELWDFAAECCRKNAGVIRILADSGCITTDNRTQVLHAMETIPPQAKAMLLRWYGAHTEKGDFFEEMEL